MSDTLFSGKWFGHFTFELGYPETYKDKKVGFVLQLTVEDGLLTGICYDEEVIDLMEGSITVNGFIENNFISFIKQYPAYYTIDENNTAVIDVDRQHPPIHYCGTYNKDTNTFSGSWEMEVPHPAAPFTHLHISTGGWAISTNHQVHT